MHQLACVICTSPPQSPPMRYRLISATIHFARCASRSMAFKTSGKANNRFANELRHRARRGIGRGGSSSGAIALAQLHEVPPGPRDGVIREGFLDAGGAFHPPKQKGSGPNRNFASGFDGGHDISGGPGRPDACHFPVFACTHEPRMIVFRLPSESQEIISSSCPDGLGLHSGPRSSFGSRHYAAVRILNGDVGRDRRLRR